MCWYSGLQRWLMRTHQCIRNAKGKSSTTHHRGQLLFPLASVLQQFLTARAGAQALLRTALPLLLIHVSNPDFLKHHELRVSLSKQQMRIHVKWKTPFEAESKEMESSCHSELKGKSPWGKRKGSLVNLVKKQNLSLDDTFLT